ncbi:MAG TPA: RNA 2',3'-cyclic phosphodiesterase [Candidatus Limnocylindrales bacterium]|nr:RNA 2',3'-cyclic phosphodiesterase [Candidatus Limnocylindrales bacterium]
MTVEPDAQRSWRCFLAVPIPEALRSSLADAVAILRGDPQIEAEWRFADAGGWHVTLAFLGATPADSVRPLVDDVAEAVNDQVPFQVTTDALGVFPSRRHARVLWYGVQDPDRRLRELARLVQAAAELEDGTPFRPHVTLARARDRRGTDAKALLAGGVPAGSVPVRGVTLFRSHLGRGPARYEILAEVPLGAAVGVGALQ